MNIRVTTLLIAGFPLFLSACSLNYGDNNVSEAVVPEILSRNAIFSRIDSGATTFQVVADTIEQYKDENISFAQNVSFKSYDKDGTLNSEGKCSLLSANSDTEEYILLNDITIQNYARNLKITAKNLRWNGKTEQLVSEKDESITIQRDNILLSGKGFSASAISNTFKFSGAMEGVINSNENGDAADAPQNVPLVSNNIRTEE